MNTSMVLGSLIEVLVVQVLDQLKGAADHPALVQHQIVQRGRYSSVGQAHRLAH